MGSDEQRRRCPAGRAHFAWSGHFVTCIPFWDLMGCTGPPASACGVANALETEDRPTGPYGEALVNPS